MYNLLQELEIKIKFILEQRNVLLEEKKLLIEEKELLLQKNIHLENLIADLNSTLELQSQKLENEDETILAGMVVQEMLNTINEYEKRDLKCISSVVSPESSPESSFSSEANLVNTSI